ncbi:unnamed protein product [Clavelina lepadiformis]|uniref:Uncharacterized protein n=1 Tax=Clavelina lepadiformis TaxID=159417 RepID=A0ABP0GV29_CLALP
MGRRNIVVLIFELRLMATLLINEKGLFKLKPNLGMEQLCPTSGLHAALFKVLYGPGVGIVVFYM